MKKLIFKSFVMTAFFCGSLLFVTGNVQSAVYAEAAEVTCLEETADASCLEEATAESSSVVCLSWKKVSTGSRCTGTHQGMCICYEYWDNEERKCAIPGTSWGWTETRKTNFRTAGC